MIFEIIMAIVDTIAVKVLKGKKTRWNSKESNQTLNRQHFFSNN